MSHHRSRWIDDRDRSHSSHRYDKYEHRSHRRDDSKDRDRDRDRDYYYSKKSSRRDRYRSKSRSPSHGHLRHRSRTPGHSSSRNRSRSKSPGYSSSFRYHDDYQRSLRSKDYNELSSSRCNSREHSQSRHNTSSYDKCDVSNKSKYETSNQTMEQMEPITTTKINDSSQSSNEYNNTVNEKPKTVPFDSNDPDGVLEEEKQRIQRETLERLQKHLQAEGKAYPPPKPQASHPIFANDGSFLEMFKSMQGNMQQQQQQQPQQSTSDANPSNVPSKSAQNLINRIQPINRRRGAKILKTGIVQKQRIIEDTDESAASASSDSWNAYLKEVKRYKTVTCSDDSMTRSLVK